MIYHYVRVEINSCKDVNVQLIILLRVPLNKNLLSEKNDSNIVDLERNYLI